MGQLLLEPAVIISNDLKTMLAELASFEAYAKIRGYNIRGYTTDSLRAFANLPSDSQTLKLRQLSKSISILTTSGGSLLPRMSPLIVKEEISSIRGALAEYNLESLDPLDFIKRGQIIEIYDSNGIQIYRNLEFCKQCGYDLLTLCVYQWFELYERCDSVTKSLLNKVGAVLGGGTKTIPFDVPEHTMRQKHLNLNKIFRIVPGHVSPLVDKTTKVVSAALTTLGSVEIADNELGKNLLHLNR